MNLQHIFNFFMITEYKYFIYDTKDSFSDLVCVFIESEEKMVFAGPIKKKDVKKFIKNIDQFYCLPEFSKIEILKKSHKNINDISKARYREILYFRESPYFTCLEKGNIIL